MAHYALNNLPSKVLAARYESQLRAEKLLADEVEKTRKQLNARQADKI